MPDPFALDAPPPRVAPVPIRASMCRVFAREHARRAKELRDFAHDQRRIAARQEDAYWREKFEDGGREADEQAEVEERVAARWGACG